MVCLLQRITAANAPNKHHRLQADELHETQQTDVRMDLNEHGEVGDGCEDAHRQHEGRNDTCVQTETQRVSSCSHIAAAAAALRCCCLLTDESKDESESAGSCGDTETKSSIQMSVSGHPSAVRLGVDAASFDVGPLIVFP